MREGARKAALLLEKLPPPEVEAILAHLSDSERAAIHRELRDLNDGPLFSCLDDWPAEAVASLLQQQHPQLSLAILRELPGPLSEAAFQACLPTYRVEVLRRLRTTHRPDDDVLRLVDAALRREVTR